MNVVEKERIQPLDRVVDFAKTTTVYEDLVYKLMKAVVLMEQRGHKRLKRVIGNYITPDTNKNWKIGLKRNFERACELFEKQGVKLKLVEENGNYHIDVSYKTTDDLDPELLAGTMLQDMYEIRERSIDGVIYYNGLLFKDYDKYLNKELKEHYQKAINLTIYELKHRQVKVFTETFESEDEDFDIIVLEF